jgi:hypothetical protein
VKTSYYHPAQTAPPFVRAQTQLALLVADPAHPLTPADVREIRRAVAISTMSQPQPRDTVALYLDLSEQFALPVRAIMHIVAGGRPGGRA